MDPSSELLVYTLSTCIGPVGNLTFRYLLAFSKISPTRHFTSPSFNRLLFDITSWLTGFHPLPHRSQTSTNHAFTYMSLQLPAHYSKIFQYSRPIYLNCYWSVSNVITSRDVIRWSGVFTWELWEYIFEKIKKIAGNCWFLIALCELDFFNSHRVYTKL